MYKCVVGFMEFSLSLCVSVSLLLCVHKVYVYPFGCEFFFNPTNISHAINPARFTEETNSPLMPTSRADIYLHRNVKAGVGIELGGLIFVHLHVCVYV